MDDGVDEEMAMGSGEDGNEDEDEEKVLRVRVYSNRQIAISFADDVNRSIKSGLAAVPAMMLCRRKEWEGRDGWQQFHSIGCSCTGNLLLILMALLCCRCYS